MAQDALECTGVASGWGHIGVTRWHRILWVVLESQGPGPQRSLDYTDCCAVSQSGSTLGLIGDTGYSGLHWGSQPGATKLHWMLRISSDTQVTLDTLGCTGVTGLTGVTKLH